MMQPRELMGYHRGDGTRLTGWAYAFFEVRDWDHFLVPRGKRACRSYLAEGNYAMSEIADMV